MCSYTLYTGRWARASPSTSSQRIKLNPHEVSAYFVEGNERYDYFEK
jgi:hypothetical protein